MPGVDTFLQKLKDIIVVKNVGLYLKSAAKKNRHLDFLTENLL